jgi:hypothetical protein
MTRRPPQGLKRCRPTAQAVAWLLPFMTDDEARQALVWLWEWSRHLKHSQDIQWILTQAIGRAKLAKAKAATLERRAAA